MNRPRIFDRAYRKLTANEGRPTGEKLAPLEERVMEDAIRREAARNDPQRRRERWVWMPPRIPRPLDLRKDSSSPPPCR